ncbi:PQQ-dependent sugar dehydrogenase [Rhodopirellula sp. ICT_H3.1]|uniref:PQQ-dependent sugar dehydrogenase n=1 Tax=Aporhodopirellula aestuarii TaxID=2950107 RepID=A0ABT0UDR0_9BACT|nr:PVC-type heme-binding CxxCH protein [Aporhodopirellula aestuarii]MCM2375033.1 PQQ-dependent sugar dehydrogenase [Aporhodopirellula aestuarii]
MTKEVYQPSGWRSAVVGLLFGVQCASFALAVDVAGVDLPASSEPPVAETSPDPAEAMSVIRLEPEWKIELFAAEPDVANIVALDVDNHGRVFVCESYRQDRGVTDNRAHDETWLLADLASRTVQDRIDYHKRLLGDGAAAYAQQEDRIRRLVDTDGDGTADLSTIFADGFSALEEGTGAGVLAHGEHVYYTCIPKLWRMTDINDDGIADEQTVMSDGYGVRVAFRGHDLHGLTMGYDGRLYFSIGDRGFHVATPDGRVLSNPAEGAVFRCELDGSDLRVFAHGLRNPQELAFNDYGDWFTVDNNSDSGDKARVVALLEGGDSGWRMHYQYLPDRGPFGRQKLWEPHQDNKPAHLVPPIANLTDGPAGLAFYPGTGFGSRLKDRFLICDFRGGPSNSGIRSFELKNAGAFYSLGDNDQPVWNVLATDIAFGPGGGMFVSDWVDGWEGLGKGRIYRITDPSQQNDPIVAEVRELLASNVADASIDELSQRLEHTDRRVRLAAQWELARRGAVDALIATASSSELDPRFRLHGFWGAEHAVRLRGELRDRVIEMSRNCLDDESPWIRAVACDIAGDQKDSAAVEQIISLISDDNARVGYHALMGLCDLLPRDSGKQTPLDPAILRKVIGRIDANANTDPALRHAAIRFLATAVDDQSLVDLKSFPSVDVRRAAVAALRARRSEKVAEFLADPETIVVAEAAMAIHDEPIPVAEEALAELIDAPDLPIDSEPLLRRVLSAGFRIGTTEAATAIAGFAASDRSPVWARIEAIDSLADWSKPDPRCRVTNEYDPLPPRPEPTRTLLPGTTVKPPVPGESVAKSALASRIDELMLASDAVREKAIDVGSKLGIVKIAPSLVKRFTNKELRPSTRASALTALGRLQTSLAIELAREIDLQQPVQIVLASLKILGKYDSAGSIERLIAATESSSQLVRGLAWDLIADNESPRAVEHLQVGLEQYLSGQLPTDVRLNVAEAVRRRLPESAEQLDSYQKELQATEPLAKWLDSLYGGDSQAGEKIFFGKTELSCVRCHKVDRAGGEVGPNLTVIGKSRDRRTLLESICLPDARIAEGFETAVIADEDGGVFTGIVASENDEVVELIAADGTRNLIEKDLIVARKKGKSSMPAGLADLMTPRELRDLVAYLAGLQVDPRTSSDTE